MRKVFILVVGMLAFSACGGSGPEVNHEHDGISCVYDVEWNFVGDETKRTLLFCGPTPTTGTTN